MGNIFALGIVGDGAALAVEEDPKVCTYNVNSLKGRKADVKYLLERSQPRILALQETLIEASHYPIRFRGFQSFASPGIHGPSHMGLGLLVDNTFQAELLNSKLAMPL